MRGVLAIILFLCGCWELFMAVTKKDDEDWHIIMCPVDFILCGLNVGYLMCGVNDIG